MNGMIPDTTWLPQPAIADRVFSLLSFKVIRKTSLP